MRDSELHVQAGIWRYHDAGMAVLFMEGEPRDRSNGGEVAVDALYRVVLARGLRLTTDLEHLPPWPVPGWWLQVDQAGGVTVTWPHVHPLLDHVPLELPPGWLVGCWRWLWWWGRCCRWRTRVRRLPAGRLGGGVILPGFTTRGLG